jgi:hypothetical protein
MAIEDQRFSGFIVGAADIDVAADSIGIDYHQASALTFGISNFNGYVLGLFWRRNPAHPGLAIDRASTAYVVDAKLSFDENTARINVAGLTVNSESKLIVSLLFVLVTDAATPFSGSWVGTVQQGTSKTFDYQMDLVQRGTSVSGTTRISTASSYGVLSVSGSVAGSSLTFTEGAVYEQQITSGSRWCLKQGTLTLSSANTRVLAGPWTASGCQAGTIQV